MRLDYFTPFLKSLRGRHRHAWRFKNMTERDDAWVFHDVCDCGATRNNYQWKSMAEQQLEALQAIRDKK